MPRRWLHLPPSLHSSLSTHSSCCPHAAGPEFRGRGSRPVPLPSKLSGLLAAWELPGCPQDGPCGPDQRPGHRILPGRGQLLSQGAALNSGMNSQLRSPRTGHQWARSGLGAARRGQHSGCCSERTVWDEVSQHPSDLMPLLNSPFEGVCLFNKPLCGACCVV